MLEANGSLAMSQSASVYGTGDYKKDSLYYVKKSLR